MTALRTTMRPSCATGPSCVRPMSMHCSNPCGAIPPGRQKGGERRHDIEISRVRCRFAPPTPYNQTFPAIVEGRDIMMMNRRAFSAALVTSAAASLISTRGMAANSTPAKASNVVLVHGLFADGSCWSEVIARLQAAGLNATAVQNPLTTLPEAVASAQRVLARQGGPKVLVGRSFSGMIVTEAGMHPNVSALVYVAARAPDAGEDYTALAKTFPTPPASAGIVFDGDEGRLSEAAFVRDFAGDLPEAKAKVLYAVQEPFQKALLTGKTGIDPFGGHPESLARGAADAKNTSTVFAGVSPTDGRPRPCWT